MNRISAIIASIRAPWTAVLIIGVFLASCAPPAVVRPPADPLHPRVEIPYDRIPDAYQGAVRQAEEALAEGRLKDGFRLYDSLLDRDPPPAATSWTRYRMGELLVSLERTPEAARFFESALPDAVNEAFEEEVVRALARAYGALERYDRIRMLAEGYREREVSPELKAELFEKAAGGFRNEGRWADALEAYVSLVHEAPGVPAADRARRAVEALIEQRLDRDELKRLAVTYDRRYPGGSVVYRLARLFEKEGRLDRAEDYLREFLDWYEDHPSLEEARERYRSVIDRRKDDYYTIGCLLPLTGRFAPYGAKVLDAIILAAGVFDTDRGTPVRLAVRDSRSDPAEAGRALRELVRDENVMAIIGPLESRSALAAAREAEALEVPLLTLTQREDITDLGSYVFRHFITIDLQVDALVEHAMNRLGMQRFAILHPDDSFGREMMFRFWQAVARSGGDIGGIESYGNDQTDFSDQINRLAPPRRGGGPPAVHFDALFVPDSALAARLIAPQLEFHDLIGVRLLGMSEWNVPELVQGETDYLEGALFLDVFFRQGGSLESEDFLDRFYAAFGREADGIEALAYDAASMLIEGVLAEEVRTRKDFRDWLLAMDTFPGVTGPVAFSGTGDARTNIHLLTVQNGRIVPVQ